jgi:hypothetical protein
MTAAAARQIRDRLSHIGADAADDAERLQRKSLLVLTSILVMPVALAWGIVYLAFGQPAGILPFFYLAVSVGSLLVFARTHDAESNESAIVPGSARRRSAMERGRTLSNRFSVLSRSFSSSLSARRR